METTASKCPEFSHLPSSPTLSDPPSSALLVPSSEVIPSSAPSILSSGFTQAISDALPTCPSPPPFESEAKIILTKRSLTIPEVIPLHGTLDSMHCTKCHHIEPLGLHLAVLDQGNSVFCPRCETANVSRNALGERSRGTGVMKVSVVLYGEEHAQAARIGEIAEKDLLRAARPEFLIVAGTTLKIPGVKKLVKELAKVIKPEIEVEVTDSEGKGTGTWIKRTDPSTKVIYINNEAPTPETVWKEIFDTFIQGDVQVFANAVREELKAVRLASLPKTFINLTLPSMFGSALSMKKFPISTAELIACTMKKKKLHTVPGKSKQSLLMLNSNKGKIKSSMKINAAKAPVILPPEPKKVKEKVRPGWKGWASVPENEHPAIKTDFWAPKAEGKRRRAETVTAVDSSSDTEITVPVHPPPLVRQRKSVAVCRTAKEIEEMACQEPEMPDLRLYCLCNGIDTGRKMVQCDGENCRREWFHVACLPSKRAPKGEYLCDECRPIANLPRRIKAAAMDETLSTTSYTAPSPPSLVASDISTASEEEEIRSQKAEDPQTVPNSQESDLSLLSINHCGGVVVAQVEDCIDRKQGLLETSSTIFVDDSQPQSCQELSSSQQIIFAAKKPEPIIYTEGININKSTPINVAAEHGVPFSKKIKRVKGRTFSGNSYS